MPGHSGVRLLASWALLAALPACAGERGCASARPDSHSIVHPLSATHTAHSPVDPQPATIDEPSSHRRAAAEVEVLVDLDAAPRTGGAPLEVEFRAHVLAPFDAHEFGWEFGDGTVYSGGPAVRHTYRTAGNYTATVSVLNGELVATAETEIRIRTEGFAVEIDLDHDAGPVPLAIRFSADVDDDAGAPHRYLWEFGDGARSHHPAPNYVYRTPGDYVAKVTVTNVFGQVGKDALEINAEPNQGIGAE